MSYGTKKWNDLEWGIHLEQPITNSKSRSSEWQCGDPRKLQKLMSLFSKFSSAHGTAYICGNSRTSKYMKIVYRVLFVVCLMSMVASIVFLLQESFSKESIYINSINKDTATGREEDPEYFPHYPRITICPRPPFRTDLNSSMLQLAEYANLALGFPFTTLTPKEVSHVQAIARFGNDPNLAYIAPEAAVFQSTLDRIKIEYEKYKNSTEDFNLKTFVKDNSYECNEFFIDCIALVFTLNCCEIFERSLTPFGLCYEMVLDKKFLQVMTEAKIDFTLTIDLKTTPHLARPLEEGYLIAFSDPRADSSSIMFQDMEMAIPHYMTSLKVKLIKTQRRALHTAWHSLSESCPRMPGFEGMNVTFGERYCLATCDTYYLMSVYRKFCKCESIIFSGNSSLRLCDPEDVYRCAMAAFSRDNLTAMHRICQNPCVEYSFKSDASYIGLGGTNNSRLMIVYAAQQFIYREYRTTTFSSLFSQIGGSLGLYLGASIITSVELISFTMSWLWYRLFPTRKTKVEQIAYPQGRGAYFR